MKGNWAVTVPLLHWWVVEPLTNCYPSGVPPTHFKRPGDLACACLHACVFVVRFFNRCCFLGRVFDDFAPRQPRS